MLVKICGLTSREDAEMAAAAGADLLGLVFVPGTPRAVDPGSAGWIRDLHQVATVGVFRNAALERVLELRRVLELDWVQLHGDEPDRDLEQLGEQVLRWVPARSNRVDWTRVEDLSSRCLPLIDPGAGNGLALDWTRLGRTPEGVDFGLAGGLDASNVGSAIAALDPALVDVSSGVEARPGVKDPGRIEAFVAAVREATRGE